MSVAAAIEKMTEFYKGNLHDVAHFMKVWGFARTIGQLEGLDQQTQQTLEYTAVVHDIACPLCREAVRQRKRQASGVGKSAAGGGVLR